MKTIDYFAVPLSSLSGGVFITFLCSLRWQVFKFRKTGAIMNRCFYVSEIDWDTDGEKIDGLPTEVIVELDHCDEDDDFEMYIVNELSDNFGWFVNSFTFELMPEEVEE